MEYGKYKQLEFRRKFLRVFGAEIQVTDPTTHDQVGYIEMKAWKLREDVRLYADSSKQRELLRIHARSVIDFGAAYDVFDSSNGELLFTLRRKGMKSTFLRDHWDVVSVDDKPIASVQETSSSLALIRRYVGIIPVVGFVADLALSVLPLMYQISNANGTPTASVTHRKNPFIVKHGLAVTNEAAKLDPRVSVAVVSLLSVIDASKN